MQTAKVIQLSDYIPRKPADRGEQCGPHYRCYHCKRVFPLSEQPAHRNGACRDRTNWQTYRCADCHREVTLNERVNHAVYCDDLNGCGAEMRPVEAK